MASDENHTAIYNDDEDDDDEPLNDVVLDEEDDDEEEEDIVVGDGDGDESSDADTNSTSSVPAASIAVVPPPASSNGTNRPPPPTPPPIVHVFAGASTSTAAIAPMAVTPVSERKPIDDSRRLFQRLWTDEDEIELLQGFLDYTTQRGRNWSGHHHDTTAFYDQIKSRIQLDCNKNQLVEKLRRLKKKYRTVVSRISSGKEFVFKSPHDQATFEISRKIWSNLIANRHEDDDDDQRPNSNSVTPVLNLNSSGDQWTSGGFSIDMNSSDKMMMMNMGTPVSRSRKRPKVVKAEEKIPRNANSGGYEAVNNAAPVQGLAEETLKSSLSPLLKQLADNAVVAAKGIGSMAFNAIPMNFPVANLGNGGSVMEEKWRKQQILELEVYSKRLEIVQDQVKLALIELRTRGI